MRRSPCATGTSGTLVAEASEDRIWVGQGGQAQYGLVTANCQNSFEIRNTVIQARNKRAMAKDLKM